MTMQRGENGNEKVKFAAFFDEKSSDRLRNSQF